VDILGHNGTRALAVQCKHYVRKKFTLSTVTDDLAKADEAGLQIDHLIFATTAPSNAQLVREVFELSRRRSNQGLFKVSIDYWPDISRHIRLHPDIGRTFIPDFPGSTLLTIEETAGAHFALYQDDRAEQKAFQTDVIRLLDQMAGQSGLPAGLSPAARGTESDPRVAAILDIVRTHLRQGKTRDARALLEQIGSPDTLQDAFSRFRCMTNIASIALMEGRYEEAADEFLAAYPYASDNEKAHSNRAHALLLKGLPLEALAACEESLRLFPDNTSLWAIRLGALEMQGVPVPEDDLPEHLRDTPDLLFARAHILSVRGDYRAATGLLRQCLGIEEASFETKRAFLANAVAWAAVEPVSALHGQLSHEQREALDHAIRQLEPIEQFLSTIQSDHISAEMTNNAAIALELQSDIGRARAIATYALRRHPTSEGLLRIHLQDLAERDDAVGIHALVDRHLDELPIPVLGLLSEISANRGDVPWNTVVVAALNKVERDPERRLDIALLAIHARWVAGHHSDALDAARDHVEAHADHVLGQVILGRMLIHLGRRTEAQQLARTCITILSRDNRPASTLLVAGLLYELRFFGEAGHLYSRLVTTPSDDELTRRLLVCLVESDQRRRAYSLLTQLSPAVAALPSFRRIQANLARSMGDWALMSDILRQELERSPADAGLAVGYVGALYRQVDNTVLKDYLASDPQFKGATAEQEFEFAKYQAHHGFKYLAVRRLYRAYRSHSGSVQAAGFYLSQLLLGPHIPELDPPATVGPGAIVTLVRGSETRVIAIDIDVHRVGEAWPELVSPDSEIAIALQNLVPGSLVVLPGLIGSAALEITAIGSIFAFVADKAHSQIAAAASPVGPLQSVRIINDDGQPDIELLVATARQRRQHVASVFTSYAQHRFPVAMLARALGTDPVTLILDWPYKEATLFVSLGTQEERDSCIEELRSSGRRYVLDLMTLAELVRRHCFGAATRVLGRPLVPQTAREHLLLIRQLVDAHGPSSTITEHDGHLVLTDTPPRHYAERAAFLAEMLQRIDTDCEVSATAGPSEVTAEHRVLASALDGDSLDAIYLCIEKNAILVTDDAALRLLAPDAGVPMAIGVQPILMEACTAGHLSQDAYADAIFGKIADGHEFISVGANDLLSHAMRSPTQIAHGVRTALDTFRKPTLQLISGIRVCCEFLREASSHLPLATLAAYAELFLEVLQYGRDDRSAAIHRIIAHTVAEAVRATHPRLTARDRKALARILDAPPPAPIPQGPSRIAIAVHQTLMACRKEH